MQAGRLLSGLSALKLDMTDAAVSQKQADFNRSSSLWVHTEIARQVGAPSMIAP